MPFDVAGNFTRNYNFQQDRDNGIKILAARVDGEFDNFATGMNAVFFRDGRVPMQADLRMNINRITGLADGSVGSPALKFQTDASTGPYLDGLSRYAISVNGVQRTVFTTTGQSVTGNLTATGDVNATLQLAEGGVYLANRYATITSPALLGTPTAPTPGAGDNSTKIATTAFVANAYAPLASPALTGTPTAPTAAVNTNTTQIATTAYVMGQGYAKLASPTFTGTVTVAALTASGLTTLSGGAVLTTVEHQSVSSAFWSANTTSDARQEYKYSGSRVGMVAWASTGLNIQTDVGKTFEIYTGGVGRVLNISGSTIAVDAGITLTAPTAAFGTNTTQVATTAFVDRLRGLPSDSGGATTLIVGQRGKMYKATGAVTVPSGVFNGDDVVTVYNDSAAAISITQGAGVTLRLAGTATTGTRTLAQRGFATIVFITGSEAVVNGNVT